MRVYVACGYEGCNHLLSPAISQWLLHLQGFHGLSSSDALKLVRLKEWIGA